MPRRRNRWNRSTIADRIATDDAWLTRGLVAIYMRQTADEQAAGTTKLNNGIGFNGCDAEFLSSLAEQVVEWYAKDPHARRPKPLSDKQLAACRKAMAKYAGQLAKIANANDRAEREKEQEQVEQMEVSAHHEDEATVTTETIRLDNKEQLAKQ